MSHTYDREKFPPAPILEIGLSAPRGSVGAQRNSALIDTGSDFTLVPLDLLKAIDAPESRPARVRGLWSKSQGVTLYYVDIHLEQVILSGVEVVGVEDSVDAEIILGRNVLNRLILLLDGHALETDILERRPRRL